MSLQLSFWQLWYSGLSGDKGDKGSDPSPPTNPSDDACGLQGGEHAFIPEWNATETDAGGVVNRIGDGRERRLAYGFAGSVMRKVRSLRIGISVDQHNIDLGRRIKVRQTRMRDPVHTGDLFGIEPDFLMQRAA